MSQQTGSKKRRIQLLGKIEKELTDVLPDYTHFRRCLTNLSGSDSCDINEEFLLDYHNVKYSFGKIDILAKYFMLGEEESIGFQHDETKHWRTMKLSQIINKLNDYHHDAQQDNSSDNRFVECIQLIKTRNITMHQALLKKFMILLFSYLKEV